MTTNSTGRPPRHPAIEAGEPHPIREAHRDHSWMAKDGGSWSPRRRSDACAKCGDTPDCHPTYDNAGDPMGLVQFRSGRPAARRWWGVEHVCGGERREYPTLHWADEPEEGAGPRRAFECDVCGDRYAFHEGSGGATYDWFRAGATGEGENP